MSHSHITASGSSSSNFQLIINNALQAYEKRTKKNLLDHPLASQLQACDSPEDILAVLQQQIQGLDQSRSADERWSTWLDPTIHVLFTFSRTVGTVGLAFAPATVVFAGIGVLLSAAKDVRASQDTLVDVFDRIEMFFRRLEAYTSVRLTTEMTNVITYIMAEVLSILGIATKEIKESRLKKFGKTLIGRTDMEDGLKKLDKLTQEEARMAIAEVLKATHAVDERVMRVANTVAAIDNRVADVNDRVAGVDDRVARVDDRVAGVGDRVARTAHVIEDWVRGAREQELVVNDRVASIDDPVAEVIDDGNALAANQVTKQIANDVDQVNQSQLRKKLKNIHKWLSPPDPSTNHNIACDTYNKKTATWFFQGSMFREWKSTGSLLWIHGKPGSGKSILCSTIIQDIEAQCEAGEASMAYFYFDFRNATKQTLHDLVPSLLKQLSVCSRSRCDILSKFYSAHGNGGKQPSDSALTKCLKDMLALPDQSPIYVIIDALDESPNTSGIPSARERVLQLLNELVDLRLPNLHICVTSRPEVDIQDVISPLTSLRVSLHDQTGQKDDIADYVRSIVYSNSERIIRRWKKEDKDLVVEVLSERADGMFRWIFCQLEILRQCPPSSVRRFLDELPESLDETYERMLREIKKPNRDHALRVLQCLVAAIRPLRVEELAEVLAIDFDDAEGVPKLKPNWRWEDKEQALLASCSSLITVVGTGDSRVVQFSHFSVKEYLTSARLATSSQDVSRYHIAVEPAHTILAQACMGVLLQVHNHDEQDDLKKNAPLALYAAEYWVRHAQFEDVASRIKGMEYLFDADKPYFAAWRKLHDIDIWPYGSIFIYFANSHSKSAETPLYYAALCGFRNIVKQLIVKHPKQAQAIGGWYRSPAVAALAGRHFELARILRRSGSSVNLVGAANYSPLHCAVTGMDLEMVQVLVECGANVDAGIPPGSHHYSTPLSIAVRSWASWRDAPRTVETTSRRRGERTSLELVRWLLNLGADPNLQDRGGNTSLHVAFQVGALEIARLLVEHGASVTLKNRGGGTPLCYVSEGQRDKYIRLHRALHPPKQKNCCIM